MKVRILSPAEREFVEAVDYYNRQRPGLGFEFASEVQSALTRIALAPNAWPRVSPRMRRCKVRRFPYGILFQVRADEVVVSVIMHLSRDPQKWSERAEQ